ncbi:MAG: hypothetical protein ACOC2C_01525 [Cyclonatronaceae bacterium]
MMMASSAMAQLPQEGDTSGTEEVANLQLELQALRGELNGLHEQTRAQTAEQTEVLNDRMAALEQRVIGVEDRLNSIFLEISGIEEMAMLLLLFLFGVCVLTLLAVFVMRRKLIDPVHLQLSRLRAELNTADGQQAKALTAVLEDMAQDDPFVAQLLKKHGLK